MTALSGHAVHFQSPLPPQKLRFRRISYDQRYSVRQIISADCISILYVDIVFERAFGSINSGA